MSRYMSSLLSAEADCVLQPGSFVAFYVCVAVGYGDCALSTCNILSLNVVLFGNHWFHYV